nr:MAG TPA: hypothetical protein [Caudoviricetes sp.]
MHWYILRPAPVNIIKQAEAYYTFSFQPFCFVFIILPL